MQNIDKKHTVIITDRKQVDIDGVECVSTLDDDHLFLETAQGPIVIEGTDLKLENLEKANGKVMVVGKISAVIYVEKKNKNKGRMLSR